MRENNSESFGEGPDGVIRFPDLDYPGDTLIVGGTGIDREGSHSGIVYGDADEEPIITDYDS